MIKLQMGPGLMRFCDSGVISEEHIRRSGQAIEIAQIASSLTPSVWSMGSADALNEE